MDYIPFYVILRTKITVPELKGSKVKHSGNMYRSDTLSISPFVGMCIDGDKVEEIDVNTVDIPALWMDYFAHIPCSCICWLKIIYPANRSGALQQIRFLKSQGWFEE